MRRPILLSLLVPRQLVSRLLISSLLVSRLWMSQGHAGDEFISNVTCIATSRQVPVYLDERFLVSDDCITESPDEQ